MSPGEYPGRTSGGAPRLNCASRERERSVEAEADAEYRAAGRWYEKRRLGLGLEFFDAVDAALTQIVRVPKAGAAVKQLPSDLPVRRAPVKRFPYHVIYLELNAEIRVLAIAHDRRKPGYWRDRI